MSSPTAILDPQVITSGPIVLPPQRRIMILLLLALAVLLQVATSGWGPIENGADGMNAAVARELALGIPPAEITQLWNQPVPTTPVQWVTAQSFRVFNVSEWSARLPFAVANLFVVGLVFLIAERIGGFWRGLASGIIIATMSGPILHGRDGGGAALGVLLLTIAVYTAIRMLEQKSQLRWQIFYWCAMAGLLTLEKPAIALLGILAVWTAFMAFREARIRLRIPWWIAGNVCFLGVLIFLFRNDFVVLPAGEIKNAARYVWTLFPWSIVLFPALFLRLRKVLRLHESTPAEAVLWSLFLLGMAWSFLFSTEDEWPVNIACQTPIFAMLGSLIWERVTSRARIFGVAFLVALAIGGMGFCGRVAGKEWLNLLQPIWWLSSGVIIVFEIAAMVALYQRHSRAALLIIAASIIPLSYNLLDARARYDRQYTMKELGKKVELGFMPGTRIFLDGGLNATSGFLFYAPRGLQVHSLQKETLEKPRAGDFLLIEEDQISHWPLAQKIGASRTHILLSLPKN